MIDLIKELWFKRKARAFFLKVQLGPEKRRLLRVAQEVHKAKYEEYKAKYEKLQKL